MSRALATSSSPAPRQELQRDFGRGPRTPTPRRVAGIDEAGRGPLAGPVVAAAVILNPNRRIHGLADSKVLTAEERENLAPIIRARALAWSVAWADRDEIDSLNILGATFLAMRRALLGLPVCPTHIQVDGNQLPRFEDPESRLHRRSHHRRRCQRRRHQRCLHPSRKPCRDAMMRDLDRCYPGFHLGIHKGYGTPRAPRSPARPRAVAAASPILQPR